MKNNNSSIISLFLCILLAGLIGYLTFFVNTGYKKPVPEQITVEGNRLLSGDDYLAFTKLENKNYTKFSEAVIKDRFEKHPYISHADVELSKNHLRVNTTEKDIKALIIINSEPCLISADFQVLPLFNSIHELDLPLITNIKNAEKIKFLSNLKNENIAQAFKIIDALKELRNAALLNNLSEINLESGSGLVYEDDVVLNFSDLKPAVIFGRGDEARKAVSLETLWENLDKGELMLDSVDYVDLRFANHIYFGTLNKTGGIQ